MKCREIIEKLNQLAPDTLPAAGIIRDCWQAAETRR